MSTTLSGAVALIRSHSPRRSSYTQTKEQQGIILLAEPVLLFRPALPVALASVRIQYATFPNTDLYVLGSCKLCVEFKAGRMRFDSAAICEHPILIPLGRLKVSSPVGIDCTCYDTKPFLC